MAGGKETPRQKMIGLMYLVLTAMLALNVDSAVLERFIFINRTLEHQITENSKRNSATVSNIASAVDEKGNRPEDVKVLDRAKMVREATNKVIQYGDQLKQGIIQYSGGTDKETGELIGSHDMDKIATYMINQGRGDTLKNVLNNYAAFLTNETGNKFDPIAYNGKDDPYFSKRPSQRSKNFKELVFESTPTAGGLASISQYMNQVLDYETRALDVLAKKVGAKDVSFDKIVPMVMPESKVVAAGAKYEAKMFISASASGLVPEMWVDGKSIPVGPDGFGDLKFTATGGNYDKDGRVSKSFTAQIKIADSTYSQKISYIVAKPVIQIQSASVQALYRNCGNKLDVQVPALGSAYNPNFKVEGGSSLGGKGGQVTVIPTSPTCNLSVYNDGTFIGSQKFRVRQIPKPDIVLKSGGQVVDERKGVNQVPRSINLDAVPDADFAQFLPDDARYRVTKWIVTLARGARPVDTKPVNGPAADLTSWVSKARAGDRIVVEVKEVQRKNFKGDVENVSIGIGTSIKQIPIN